MKKYLTGITLAAAATLALTACGGDPMSSSNTQTAASSDSIIVGSADFPESQLIAKIYAEALESKGVQVTEKPSIGSREVTIPALKDGSIDLMPEYGGALLQYLDSATKAVSSEEVTKELARAPLRADHADRLGSRGQGCPGRQEGNRRPAHPQVHQRPPARGQGTRPRAARPSGRPGSTVLPA